MAVKTVSIDTLKINRLYGIFKSCSGSFFLVTARVPPSFERKGTALSDTTG